MVRKAHWAIAKVTDDIGERFNFNTAQSAVHELVSEIQDSLGRGDRRAAAVCVCDGRRVDPSLRAAHRV